MVDLHFIVFIKVNLDQQKKKNIIYPNRYFYSTVRSIETNLILLCAAAGSIRVQPGTVCHMHGLINS